MGGTGGERKREEESEREEEERGKRKGRKRSGMKKRAGGRWVKEEGHVLRLRACTV